MIGSEQQRLQRSPRKVGERKKSKHMTKLHKQKGLFWRLHSFSSILVDVIEAPSKASINKQIPSDPRTHLVVELPEYV